MQTLLIYKLACFLYLKPLSKSSPKFLADSTWAIDYVWITKLNTKSRSIETSKRGTYKDEDLLDSNATLYMRLSSKLSISLISWVLKPQDWIMEISDL